MIMLLIKIISKYSVHGKFLFAVAAWERHE
jgi:hypothetical protein